MACFNTWHVNYKLSTLRKVKCQKAIFLYEIMHTVIKKTLKISETFLVFDSLILKDLLQKKNDSLLK